MILRTSSSHEEGVIRDWSINTKSFSGDAHGNVKKLHGIRLECLPAGQHQHNHGACQILAEQR
jgi:NADPH-dependent glutamate synthase beta subunit-like oxidoreductase